MSKDIPVLEPSSDDLQQVPRSCDAGAMSELPVAIVRWPGATPRVEAGFAELLAAYHLATQAEKGESVAQVGDLPERYHREINDPLEVFADDVVLVAVSGDDSVGCLVLTVGPNGTAEVKRLWTDPAYRGRGIAASLISAALEEHGKHGPGIVRLSVWSWRTGALALYRRLGFIVVPSWDERDELVCLQRAV